MSATVSSSPSAFEQNTKHLSGGVVGAAGRGVGGTINNTTGTKQVGDGLQSLTNGIEDGTANLAKGVEQGSVGKKVW